MTVIRELALKHPVRMALGLAINATGAVLLLRHAFDATRVGVI
jgi:hypothetical protein